MPSTRTMKLILNSLNALGVSKLCSKFDFNIGSILMLHRVQPKSSNENAFDPNAHLCVTPEFLDELLSTLGKAGYDFVDLDEAKARIKNPDKTRRFISITLDDGYIDNFENALPVFEKHSAPFTIFVAPGLVDGRATLWWEDLASLVAENSSVTLQMSNGDVSKPTNSVEEKTIAFNAFLQLLTNDVSEQQQREIMTKACKTYGFDAQAHRAQSIMDWSQLKKIAKTPLCTIGAHTIHHYAVARLSDIDCRDELQQSASEIEKHLSVKPRHFAYPYGYPAAAGKRDFDIAKECGFETAVTTRHGVCLKKHSQYLTALPRVSLNGHFQKVSFVKALLSGAPTLLQNKGKQMNVS